MSCYHLVDPAHLILGLRLNHALFPATDAVGYCSFLQFFNTVGLSSHTHFLTSSLSCPLDFVGTLQYYFTKSFQLYIICSHLLVVRNISVLINIIISFPLWLTMPLDWVVLTVFYNCFMPCICRNGETGRGHHARHWDV